MIREKKFVFLTVLTFLMYGLGLLFDAHFFLLPFPIFDFVLLWGALRFILFNRQSRRVYNYLFLSGALLKISINPLLTAALLDQNELSYLNSSLIPDFLLVLSLLLFLLSFTAWAIQEKLSIHWLWHAFHAAIGLLALTLDFRLVLFFGLLPAILLYVKDVENNFRYIWNLFFILELMTTVMLVFVTN
jgi:hypothetical protein